MQDEESNACAINLPKSSSHVYENGAEALTSLFDRASFPVKATLIVLPKSLLKQWQRTIETQVRPLKFGSILQVLLPFVKTLCQGKPDNENTHYSGCPALMLLTRSQHCDITGCKLQHQLATLFTSANLPAEKLLH